MGGLLILTCATHGRPPHGAETDFPLPGEYYENVDPHELAEACQAAGFGFVTARVSDGVFQADDLYCLAIR